MPKSADRPKIRCVTAVQVEKKSGDSQTDQAFASRDAVLADAAGLLTCYGVGQGSAGILPHAVVELCFTSSVRFLQPGLLLQVSRLHDETSLST